MALFIRKTVLLLKEEVTQGTDSAPTGAANSMLVSNVTLRPLVVQTQDRALLRPYLGASEQIVVGEYAEVEFDIECAGGGAATTPPKWGAAIKSCGFAETVGASDVSYSPVSAAFKSSTIAVYMGDAVLHKLTGAMGTFTVNLSAGEIPRMRFRFVGVYNVPTDAASSGVAFTGFQTPLGMRDSNVVTMTVHGVAKASAPIRTFTVDMGNNVVYRNLIGATAVAITDRAPTGSIEDEAVLVATKNWYTTIRATTTAAVAVEVGSTTGNIFKFDAPAVQLNEPAFSDLDGALMFQMAMRFLPTSAGNDEVKITTK